MEHGQIVIILAFLFMHSLKLIVDNLKVIYRAIILEKVFSFILSLTLPCCDDGLDS